jgi:hypothetical protein
MVIAGMSNGFEHSGETCCGAMSLFQLHISPNRAAELQLARRTSGVGVQHLIQCKCKTSAE